MARGGRIHAHHVAALLIVVLTVSNAVLAGAAGWRVPPGGPSRATFEFFPPESWRRRLAEGTPGQDGGTAGDLGAPMASARPA